MRLLALQLHNFRQFYGVTPRIRFGLGANKVTVIHGSNGSGKTALLNAFTWALYGEFTRGFQLSDQLVNKRAILEARVGEVVEAWVDLQFEHGGRTYHLRRSAQTAKKAEDNWTSYGSEPVLQVIEGDGEARQVRNVKDAVGNVLPNDLHSYFFFDGERIERIVQPDQNEIRDLAKATKKLLGVTVLERGERHLDAVRRELEKDLRGIADPETRQLLEDKAANEGIAEEKVTRIGQLRENIAGNIAVKRQVEEQLRRLEDVRTQQERREELSQRAHELQQSLQDSMLTLRREVGEHGYLVFAQQAVERFKQLVEASRARGELPAGIKRQFVTQLLEVGECICGRRLEPGDAQARACVAAWMTKAGLAEVEEKALRMGGEVSALLQNSQQLWERLDQAQRERERDKEQLAQIERDLDEIREQLRSSPREEISGLEARLEKLESGIRDDTREIGAAEAQLRMAQSAITVLDRRIAEHSAREERQALLQRRVNAAAEARERILQVRNLLEVQLQEGLNKKTRDLFRRISVTPYVPRLAPDYRLSLIDRTGGREAPVAASQGESQVLSLSFIGALVDAAREHSRRRDHLVGAQNAEFPIVMDSPFGSLDPTYRRAVCENLHILADQVVVMVTNTQWRGEVDETLSPHIGAQYVITYHTPRPDLELSDAEDGATLTLGGTRYAMVSQSDGELEHSEICEVTRGR